MSKIDVLFILTKENFEAIKTGKKIEEYRSITNFYINKLCTIDETKTPNEFNPREDIKVIKFRLGYTKTVMTIEVKGIYIDTFENFIPEGFKKGDETFTIELGKVLEITDK
jgi:hypothetical protein